MITASSVLHHLYAPARLIREAMRVLKRQGLFVTDFDPSAIAANWSYVMCKAYTMRQPIYRVLAKVVKRKAPLHRDRHIQQINRIAEFHNGPGAGFTPGELAAEFKDAGLTVKRLFLHNTKDAGFSDSLFTKPSLRHFFAQVLSGRNPFLRSNATTLMTVSVKP